MFLGLGELLVVSYLFHSYVSMFKSPTTMLLSNDSGMGGWRCLLGCLHSVSSHRPQIRSVLIPLSTVLLMNSSLAHENVSSLGAVMAFLYSSYIVLNAVLSTLLGKVIDKDFTKNKNIIYSLKTVGG